jgi:glycosyltransferase involved in cell wall biosynthesis
LTENIDHAKRNDRLGVYVDAAHRLVETEDGRRIATDPADFAFVGVFLPEVAKRFDSLVLFGRVEPIPDVGHFALLPPEIDFVELPYYSDLRQLPAVARACWRTAGRFWRGLDRVDTMWVVGPHPFGVLLAGMALLRRRRLVLGVRQDTIAYFRARLPNRRWTPTLLVVRALDVAYRLIARAGKTVAIGPEIAQHYGGEGPRVYVMTESVVRRDQVAPGPREQDWAGELQLLTVGRLDVEKNPILLVEALGALESAHPGRYRVIWVGGGPMVEEVRRRASELGVTDRLELRGWVPFSGELLEIYRHAHLFVHVSLTEGVPKVLIEALASAIPIVATDVGGVRALLDGGRAGLLVPPSDLEALVDAIQVLARDEALRRRLIMRGLELGRSLTLEAQAERVAGFINDGLSRRATP